MYKQSFSSDEIKIILSRSSVAVVPQHNAHVHHAAISIGKNKSLVPGARTARFQQFLDTEVELS